MYKNNHSQENTMYLLRRKIKKVKPNVWYLVERKKPYIVSCYLLQQNMLQKKFNSMEASRDLLWCVTQFENVVNCFLIWLSSNKFMKLNQLVRIMDCKK